MKIYICIELMTKIYGSTGRNNPISIDCIHSLKSTCYLGLLVKNIYILKK